MGGYDGLNGGFAGSLQAFITASGGRITITSGYRSPERQAQLFAAAVKKYGSEQAARKWVAPPGRSNHGRGIAADLSFADASAREWAHANAARFGLRFPMSWEPWHIEPAGARNTSDRDAYTTSPNGQPNPRDAVDNGLDDAGNVEDPHDPSVQARRLFDVITSGSFAGEEAVASPQAPGSDSGIGGAPDIAEAASTVSAGLQEEQV